MKYKLSQFMSIECEALQYLVLETPTWCYFILHEIGATRTFRSMGELQGYVANIWGVDYVLEVIKEEK